MIAQVEPGSPAARAGLRQGDVVLAVDGSAVHSSTELRNRIALIEVGSSAVLDILRDGRRSQVSVAPALQRPTDAGDVVPALAGATLDEIPRDHPAYGHIGGVLVTRVARGSAAARAGLRRGDLIIGVDGSTVGSLAELRAALPRGQVASDRQPAARHHRAGAGHPLTGWRRPQRHCHRPAMDLHLPASQRGVRACPG